jgi:hypothetical protein
MRIQNERERFQKTQNIPSQDSNTYVAILSGLQEKGLWEFYGPKILRKRRAVKAKKFQTISNTSDLERESVALRFSTLNFRLFRPIFLHEENRQGSHDPTSTLDPIHEHNSNNGVPKTRTFPASGHALIREKNSNLNSDKPGKF